MRTLGQEEMARTLGLAALGLLIGLMHAEVEAEKVTSTCHVKPNTALEASLVQNIGGTIKLITDTTTNQTEIIISLKGFNTSDGQMYHGFHVHEIGDSNNNCNNMKGHYNPHGFNHSGPNNPMRHVGDLGNIKESSSGTVEKTMSSNVVCLVGPESVKGRGFVIHMDKDDLGLGGNEGSLATGNAGKRLACCNIPTTVTIVSSANHVSAYSLSLLCLVVANSVLRYIS